MNELKTAYKLWAKQQGLTDSQIQMGLDFMDMAHTAGRIDQLSKETALMQKKGGGSVCPICGAPIKYNSYDSGLPIQVCSNIDCDWSD